MHMHVHVHEEDNDTRRSEPTVIVNEFEWTKKDYMLKYVSVCICTNVWTYYSLAL